MKTVVSILAIMMPWSACLLRGEALTLDGAVSLALERHPQLMAARLEVAAAEARLIDAGKLPNPEIEFSGRRSQAEGEEWEGSAFAGISQRFPVTDRLRRSRDVRSAEIDLAQWEVRNAERELIAEVQSQFVRVLGARERTRLMEELVSHASAFVTLAEQRLAEAQGSELDVASARTEVTLASQARLRAESEVRAALAALRPLLALEPGAPLEPAGDLRSAIAQLHRSVTLQPRTTLERSDVVAARIELERAEAEQRLAVAQRWEDWEMAFGYEFERSVDEPVGAERDHYFGLGLRIPLPLRNRGEGRIAEAGAKAAKAAWLLQAARSVSLGEVAREIEAVHQASSLANSLATETIPLLEERREKTKQAYARGLIEFVMVLQLEQQQARLREALLDSFRDEALALVRLQAAQGSHPCFNRKP